MNLPIQEIKIVKPPVVRCAQCGEVLPVERYKDRDPREHILCADCAVENLPHTD